MSGATRLVPRQAWRAFAAQARIELVLTLRRFENLLVTLAVPLVLLVFLAAVPIESRGADSSSALASLVPRIVAVALIATGLVSLGIATAYERGYGVLKRLAGSPLPRWALLASKTLGVLATVGAQIVLIAIVAAFLGWEPPGGVAATLLRAAPWMVVGTLAFSALGLLLAGTLRPEAVLAAANGLFLVFVLLGGVIVPGERLPEPLAGIAPLLPAALLADLLEQAMTASASSSVVQAGGLVAWATGLAVAAIVAFHVDQL